MNTTILVMIALPLIYFWLAVVVTVAMDILPAVIIVLVVLAVVVCPCTLVLLMGMVGKIMIERVVVLITLHPLLLRYL